MVLLTKINGTPIALNSDMIEFIEETPDTVITLSNGDKIVVRERMTDVIGKVVDFRSLVAGSMLPVSHRRLRAVNVSARGRRP
jgi:flagellar protein FlbD